MNQENETAARWAVLTTVAIVAAGAWSCTGSDQLRTPAPAGQTLILLLPDAESGAVGRATVSNGTGAVDLAAARDSTTATGNRPPAPVTMMSEAEVKRIFGDALSALPVAASHFTLYFRFESDELTDESRALVPAILNAVKSHPSPEVAVVGHTDTTGAPAINLGLGLRRATTVRDLLIAGGMDAAFIELSSHGEAELLVPTGDEVLEPRNRRVEISVR